MSDLYIKKIKPRKNSRYKQGIINPASCRKYYAACMSDPIIYRSSLELQFIQYCENTKSIAKWASEPIKIRYFNRLDNKEANYYPDYVIENNKGDRIIVEVKPYEQTIKPRPSDSDWLKKSWIVNTDKWNAAQVFAAKHGMKFMIVTEKFFGN